MTNKERYHRTFNVLHPSDRLLQEVHIMKKHKRFYLSHAAIACLAVLILIGSGSIAYANDLGGIQRTIQLWIHGDQTEAVWEVENGHYHLTYQDADGETKERSGGGVAFNPDGTERPLTEEELMEDVYAPDTEYREDGSIWVYYLIRRLKLRISLTTTMSAISC